MGMIPLLIRLVLASPGVFTSPLPWQAELAFLIFCAFIIGMPAIIRSLRRPPSPVRKAKGARPRRTSKQANDA
jgi:hypothetical protein